jgi:hypothetical protein
MELILKSNDETFKFNENTPYIDVIIETRGMASWNCLMGLIKPFVFVDHNNKHHTIISVEYTIDRITHTETTIIKFKQDGL